MGLGVSQQLFSPWLQDGAAAAFDLLLPAGQSGEEAADPLLHLGTGSEAQVTCRLFPRPAPDGLIRLKSGL